MPLSNRVQALKEEHLRHPKAICLERARLFVESCRQTEGEHPYIVRAKALKHILTNMSIFIQDGELIVGNQASGPGKAPVFPETDANWVLEQLDHFNTREMRKYQITEGEKAQLRELLPFWEHKTLLYNGLRQMNAETLSVYSQPYPVISPNLNLRGHAGHFVPNYGRIVNEGFASVEQEVREKLAGLKHTDPGNLDKDNFYHSILICIEAIRIFAERYADLALVLSKGDGVSSQRQRELMMIHETCKRVPYQGARTFLEGVQSLWFIHMVAQIEGNGFAYSIGRADQFLNPIYERDVRENGLTEEFAQEILDCFFLKTNQIVRIADVPPKTNYFGGVNMTQNLLLGGQKPDGSDAFNKVSAMMLKSDVNVHLDQPNLSIRVHKNMNDDLLRCAIENIKKGGGKPAIFNDEIIIPSLMKDPNVTKAEAVDYGIVGCVEPVVANCTNGWTNAAMFNLAKCLELALHNGVDPFSNKQIGPETGDLSELKTYEDVLEAYNKQVAYFVEQMVIMLNTWDQMHAEYLPIPYLSSMVDGCIESGRDLAHGGAKYNYTGVQGVGLSNVADSLMALKQVVFTEKKVTLCKLVQMMDNNFEGDDYFRTYLINRVPKYGNNIDEVDNIAREVGNLYCDEVAQYQNYRGGAYRPGLFPVASHVPLGGVVGALPSGRLKGTPLNDGISPVSGCDVDGPTSSLQSVAKIEHVKATNGTLLNMKLHPTVLQSESDKEKFISLIHAFCELGLMHIQFNVVSQETLLAAQQDPQNYRDLIVRVAGYSANFIELDRQMQDDIINRTEQAI
ncbi:MAG: formate C-acetyltransferase/glycerol dehydratase family glycyl radical enzyme [Clostridiales bacterium]